MIDHLALIAKLKNQQSNTYSQYGEDGALSLIFSELGIGTTNKFLVDFGAGDGKWLSNSRLLLENEWSGLLMDGDNRGNPIVKKEFITAENICQLFSKYKVPKKFDLLSIDIDGNDLWVLKKILDGRYSPRVIIAEFNGTIGKWINKTIKYNPDHRWNNNDYYGVSFEALRIFGIEYSYTLIAQISCTNMIFVRSDIIEQGDYGIDYIPMQYHAHFPNGEWVEYIPTKK